MKAGGGFPQLFSQEPDGGYAVVLHQSIAWLAPKAHGGGKERLRGEGWFEAACVLSSKTVFPVFGVVGRRISWLLDVLAVQTNMKSLLLPLQHEFRKLQ